MPYHLAPLEIPHAFWRSTPRTDPGTQILAIGDLHGCAKLLVEMIYAFDKVAFNDLPPTQRRQIVLLGDVIDRGPSSVQIVRALYEIRDNPNFIVLMGNHESLLLDCIDCRPGAIGAWLKLGGHATIESLRLTIPDPDADEAVFADQLVEAFGEPVVEWMRGFPVSWTSGDYFFCHAGVKPGVPLETQYREDLIWIRSEFLKSKRFHGKVVVHGHSIAETIAVTPNRIGIDTGAYESGLLTGLVVQDAQAWSLEVT